MKLRDNDGGQVLGRDGQGEERGEATGLRSCWLCLSLAGLSWLQVLVSLLPQHQTNKQTNGCLPRMGS